jgi:hypothetical protein
LFRIEAHEQFGQHRYDANQHFFAGLNSIQRGKSLGRRSIRPGCAFDGRAACIIKEFSSLALPLPSAVFRGLIRGRARTLGFGYAALGNLRNPWLNPFRFLG